MSKDRTVYEMPEDWTTNFVAAWRVFERTLNPAFGFLLKCGNCGALGKPEIDFVMSKKNEKAVLGIECSKCLTTIKFNGTIDPTQQSFPKRLLTKTKSVLRLDGKETKGDFKPDGYLELMLDD